MRAHCWMISLLCIVLWSQPALAINIRVREVRREHLEGEATFIYEVENGSVDRVRFHRVEAHVFDENGRRVELQRPFLDVNPMRAGDVVFLRVRLRAEMRPLAEELRLRLLASRDLDFPIFEPRQPQPLEFRFPLKGEPGKIHTPTRAPRLKLQPIGFVEPSDHPSRFLVYRLTNEGPETFHGVLELRYLGRGFLHVKRHLALQRLLAGEERMIQVGIPKDLASRLGGLEVKAVPLDGEEDLEPPPAGPRLQEASTSSWQSLR